MKKSEFIAQAMIRLCAVQSVEYGDGETPIYRFLTPDEARSHAARFWNEYSTTVALDPNADRDPSREDQ